MITAYSHPFDNIVSRILIDCLIGIPHSEGVGRQMKALWDTGACCTCIATSVAREMGLIKVNEKQLIGADNKPFMAEVFCVKLKMGHFEIGNLEVCGIPMEGKAENMIIGMDVITKGDLSITNYQGKTVLTFREPSLEKIDYVEELRLQKKCQEHNNIMIRQNAKNAKCACGSDKTYKYCHGKSI